jgi:2-phospho-L-lactate transferase/gluconeogenesis factor (CofD/UPF0052 family)
LRSSRALKFFICNVASQRGETDGYTAGDHARTVEKHMGGRMFDMILCNRNYNGVLPEGIDWIYPEPKLDERYSSYFADLLDEEKPWRHDSNKLAEVVMDLYYERTGPLNNREDN